MLATASVSKNDIEYMNTYTQFGHTTRTHNHTHACTLGPPLLLIMLIVTTSNFIAISTHVKFATVLLQALLMSNSCMVQLPGVLGCSCPMSGAQHSVEPSRLGVAAQLQHFLEVSGKGVQRSLLLLPAACLRWSFTAIMLKILYGIFTPTCILSMQPATCSRR
jgi:hypothetical protein